MDKVDFEASVGLPITQEQFDAFKLLYQSGRFTNWMDFAKKAQPIVKRLHLPGTECCLEDEGRCWSIVCEFHPDIRVRREAKEIHRFLRDLKMWFTLEGTIFRNEFVGDYILHALQDIGGVCISRYGNYTSSAELDIPAVAAFCEKLPDTVCYATGRTWREEMKGMGLIDVDGLSLN